MDGTGILSFSSSESSALVSEIILYHPAFVVHWPYWCAGLIDIDGESVCPSYLLRLLSQVELVSLK